ncbi:hypothetical protein PCL_10552 [Purpureocillium lilacinum]|uniref:Uncharacterized protein n=1 Tax=Purpureocillium lilacinum TaxID=33203 RepID=A0A2U3DQ35_PURLI|nr:hypothetical protein PCL_10552 [Purpureocillium lilacinum]
MSQSEIIQALLAKRSAPQWRHRGQDAPARLSQTGIRKVQGNGAAVSRTADNGPSNGLKDLASQPMARQVPFTYANGHAPGDMWLPSSGESSSLQNSESNTLQARLSRLEDMVLFQDSQVEELLQSKEHEKAQVQEVWNSVKLLVDMYPAPGQDAVDPSLAFQAISGA